MHTLTLEHISVTADTKEVVHDVSFSLTEGTVSVLMGPNGSGKSSLVNALMGHPHYHATGTLILDGVDVLTAPPEEKARKGLFISLQHTPKVAGVTLATFLHKVHVSRTGADVSVLEYYLMLREVAERFGISDSFLDRPLSAGLSGGEKKLSEALQLAVLKPRFAFLDEMDSGVDVDALKKLFGVVSALSVEGTGFLIISHHPSLLSHLTPERVHIMQNGALAKSGGRDLAEVVLKDGFCSAIECPLRDGCEVKG
jgi:Fe-S cluster assembly ATP-binding protein